MIQKFINRDEAYWTKRIALPVKRFIGMILSAGLALSLLESCQSVSPGHAENQAQNQTQTQNQTQLQNQPQNQSQGLALGHFPGHSPGNSPGQPITQRTFTPLDSLKAPRFRFIDSTLDFGTLTEGAIVHHRFRFRNTGHSPLIVTNVQTSCGCTTPRYDLRPVAASDTSSLEVWFDSKGKFGPQTKIITIFANTIPAIHRLVLVGIVQAK